MIRSFGDKATEDLFNGSDTKDARTIPKAAWGAARRKLDMINAAHDIRDLMRPPGNRLEKLKGKKQGRYSIRVNDQYRITFVWSQGNAEDVTIEDYH